MDSLSSLPFRDDEEEEKKAQNVIEFLEKALVFSCPGLYQPTNIDIGIR